MRLVCNKGINDLKGKAIIYGYSSWKDSWEYQLWRDILTKTNTPNYEICKQWLRFSTFICDLPTIDGYGNKARMILTRGNMYGPKTVRFVSNE